MLRPRDTPLFQVAEFESARVWEQFSSQKRLCGRNHTCIQDMKRIVSTKGQHFANHVGVVWFWVCSFLGWCFFSGPERQIAVPRDMCARSQQCHSAAGHGHGWLDARFGFWKQRDFGVSFCEDAFVLFA